MPEGVNTFHTLITYDPFSTHQHILDKAKYYMKHEKRYFQDSLEFYMGDKGKYDCDANACRQSDCASHVKNVNYVMAKKDGDANCGTECKLCKCKWVTDRWKQNCSVGLPDGQPVCA